MAFSELEFKRYEKLTKEFIEKHRPPVNIRSQLDLGYKIYDYAIEIYEIRPLYNDPNKKIEEAIAKAKYVRKSNSWKIYWQRADLKWHSYDPIPYVDSLEYFFAIVSKDEYACFWG